MLWKCFVMKLEFHAGSSVWWWMSPLGHGAYRNCCVSVGWCGTAVLFPKGVSGTISLESPEIQALGVLSDWYLCDFKGHFAVPEPCLEDTEIAVYHSFMEISKYVCVKWGLSSTPQLILSLWDQWS